MVAVLEVTPEERPVLSYAMARLIPMLRRDTSEDQEVAEHLAFALNGVDQAPAGSGEIEFERQDLYALGIHMYATGVDLQEYWLDRLQVSRGRPPVEEAGPDVAYAIQRYFPEIDAAPAEWTYRSVEPAFISLGFKLDALMTAEAPRARGLYNNARGAIVRPAIARQESNAAMRGPEGVAASATAPVGMLAAPVAAGDAGHADDPVPLPRPRPVGTAAAPAGVAPLGLSVISRATYPPQYTWGVRTSTGVMADDLEPNKPVKVNLGGAAIMLVNVDGKVCAVSRICTHRAWDLAGGMVQNSVITCGLHGAQYNVCSGEVVREPFDPAFNREHSLLGRMMSAFDPKKTCVALDTYPTGVDDSGEVFVHI